MLIRPGRYRLFVSFDSTYEGIDNEIQCDIIYDGFNFFLVEVDCGFDCETRVLKKFLFARAKRVEC